MINVMVEKKVKEELSRMSIKELKAKIFELIDEIERLSEQVNTYRTIIDVSLADDGNNVDTSILEKYNKYIDG